MRPRSILGAVAVFAALAAGALAFENTAWFGNLNCRVKVRVRRGESANVSQDATDVGLSTQTTSFDMGPLGGGTMHGQMTRRNARNYRISNFTEGTDASDFVAWVRAKVLAATEIDVNIETVRMKGTFVLIHDFQEVKVGDKVTFTGTVASGPDSGKSVRGSITVKGILPRD